MLNKQMMFLACLFEEMVELFLSLFQPHVSVNSIPWYDKIHCHPEQGHYINDMLFMNIMIPAFLLQ